MRTAIIALALVGLSASALLADAVSAAETAVVNPWISTDRSVDCRTIDTIVKSLVAKDMTDEQKVLAVFNWTRRMLYHGDGLPECAYDFGRMIHSYGNGSCLRQTTPMWVVLDRLGYKCRTGSTEGHHIMEVQYGGKWHLLDPHMCFYVYDRAKPPAIISIEDIKTDPTLVTDAVKEGRACPGFLACGDEITTFSDYSKFSIAGAFPETKKAAPLIEEPFGQIALRRGETYVRTWVPGDYWFKANWYEKNRGPRHGCGLKADGKDTVNFPLYEPHVVDRAGRHWSAGYILYKPDLKTDHYRDALADSKNIDAKSVTGLKSAADGQAGEVTFRVDCPYAVTACELKLTALGQTGPKASVSIDAGKTWKPIKLEQKDNDYSAVAVDEVNGALHGYLLKIDVGSGLAALEAKTHFQINMYSLPYLVPGKNVVNVAADKFGSPVKVEWTYAEGPEWKENKTASETFAKPGQLTVEVKGEKYPRNVSLTLSVAP